MSPTRPLFADGAILGAGDLTALEQLDRDRDARATRHLHTPGVAMGLGLDKATPPGQTGFVEVTLQPGYAIDGTGRELVVPAALALSPDQFAGDITNPVTQPAPHGNLTVWYPVFIHGLDAPVIATNGKTGCEGGGGPTRIAEDVEIEFGRPGDATLEQTAPPPDAGPGTGTWRVLVGFVQFDTSINQFADAQPIADGVRVPTAGVRAGLVAGQSGRVEIRPQPAAASGVPVVVVDADKRGSLLFGLHTGTGAVEPLMTVDAEGNLTVKGTLGGAQTAGTVRVLSGTASDGAVLPLPAGTTQEAVDDGKLEVSILVTPRYPEPPQLGDRFIPAECRVDSDRRVHCWGTRFVPGGAWQADVPLSCDYLVLVSVAQGGP